MRSIFLLPLLLSIVAADNNVIRRRRLNAHGVRNEKAAIVQEDAGLWGRMLDDYSMSCPKSSKKNKSKKGDESCRGKGKAGKGKAGKGKSGKAEGKSGKAEAANEAPVMDEEIIVVETNVEASVVVEAPAKKAGKNRRIRK